MNNFNTFKDQNELNLFIIHIQSMRKAQKARDKLAKKLSPTHPDFIKAVKDVRIFEKQVDDILDRIPPVAVVFFWYQWGFPIRNMAFLMGKGYFCNKVKNMTVTEAFGDVADIIARMDPAKIVGLKASKQMSDRVEHLVNSKKDNVITIEEAAELERLLALDLFISLAKARAFALLKAA